MGQPLEEYALIGDTQTAALVGRDGSIDWLCLPRFDSEACFAALLGGPEHGRWLLTPVEPVRSTSRRYRPDTLVLETTFTTDSGAVRLVDCMPPRTEELDVIRLVEGVRGEVRMRMEMIIRFDYGLTVPWVRKVDGSLRAIAGANALYFKSEVPTEGRSFTTVAEFTVKEGQKVPFLLAWYPSNQAAPSPLTSPEVAAEECAAWWRTWVAGCTYDGDWRDAVVRSLITLKALTFAPTGGIVAAPTTSLPEKLGGKRNWDYRYCWLRDATFTLYALMEAGYRTEAAAWRDWLLRAVAGDPSQMQPLYGAAGERRLQEGELDWLPGYEGARPVRVGNAAFTQLQLDIYGEVMDSLHLARRLGVEELEDAWEVQKVLAHFLESHWDRPDRGIWEVRGDPQHFTYSKVMTWVAMDRAIKGVERFGLEGPVDRWRALRASIHRDVCAKGFDQSRGTFTQAYGSKQLDAALLLLPLVGFLPPKDPRIQGTVAAIERELRHDCFVRRYSTEQDQGVDGLPPGEGAFLACSFWLADNYAVSGRMDEARRLFERLLSLRNDVGLLSEEYDPQARRLVGNFPQAFSHVAVVNTARNLSRAGGPAEHRAGH